MAGATLAVNFIGHTDKLRSALNDTEKRVGTFGDKLDRFGTKAQAFGKKMSTFVTLPVLGAGVAAFKMAGDFGESFSKMETVFGSASKGIDAWSKGTAKAIGLSRTEAITAAGDFGNMFTQLGIGVKDAGDMSMAIVDLAADFASFHNADITEVINAQSAAFRGEYDSLQKFLPLINAATVEQKALEMTGKKLTAELTAQEKALAVERLMLEGAGVAVGDFARTSDSAANKQRVLTAEFKDAATEMGTNLLPIGQKILDWAGSLTDKFAGLEPEMQTTVIVVGLAAAAIGPLVTLVGTLTTAVGYLTTAVRGLNTAIKANPLVALAAAFTAVYVISEKVTGGFDGIKGHALSLNETISNLKRDVENLIDTFEEFTSLGMGGGDSWFTGSPLKKLPGVGKFFKAAGGPVAGGSPYIVGEQGPELFVPRQSGTIIPNGAGVGGGTTVNVTVNGALDGRAVAGQILGILLEHQKRTGSLGLT